jgi:hypothetical protein
VAPGLRAEHVEPERNGRCFGVSLAAFSSCLRKPCVDKKREDALNELKMFSDGLKNAWVAVACNMKVCDHTIVPRALGTQEIAAAIITKIVHT